MWHQYIIIHTHNRPQIKHATGRISITKKPHHALNVLHTHTNSFDDRIFSKRTIKLFPYAFVETKYPTKNERKKTEKLEIKDERIAPKEVRHIFIRFHGMRVPKEQTNTETKWWP